MPNPSAPTFLPPGVNPDGPYPVTPNVNISGNTVEAKVNRATLAGRGEYPAELLSEREADFLRQLESAPYYPIRRARPIPLANDEKGFMKKAPLEPPIKTFSFFL